MATQGRINKSLRDFFSFLALDPTAAQAAEISPFSRKARYSMHISDLLDNRFILFLDAASRDEAIHELIDKLDAEQVLPDAQAFHEAIQHRERLVSTAIGSGVAVPHARMEGYKQFFLAVGIQRTQGVDWNALDQVPVRLVFLLGGPGDQQTEYLQLLSNLTHMLKDPDLRKHLLQSTNAEEVIKLLA